MNTTHISCVIASQASRQGDTGVICFCQKHRNSLKSPPVVDKACMHSLASSRGGMCSCCDYLPLQRKGSLSGPMEKCCCLPSAMISALVCSWVSTEGKRVWTRPGISIGSCLSCNYYYLQRSPDSQVPHSTLGCCMESFPSVCSGSVIRRWLYIWFEYCIVNGLNP